MMKNYLFLLGMFLLFVGNKLSAQTTINLAAASDTIFIGDSRNSLTTKVFRFDYDAKLEAIFAQVSMDVHNLNPFDLPEIVVNGNVVHANIYFPSLAPSTKFYFYKVKGLKELVVNSPIGGNNATLSFLVAAKDLLAGKNVIRLTAGNRLIENLDDFAITNIKIELRSKLPSDAYTDYTK